MLPLPAEQREVNRKLNKELGNMALFIGALFLVTAGGLGMLYMGGTRVSVDSEAAGTDGMRGLVVVGTPTLALTDVAFPDRVEITLSDRSKHPARKVRSEKFEDEVSVTMLRAESSFPGKLVPALGNAEPGQPASVTGGGATWNGSLRAKAGKEYLEMEPSMPLASSLPVIQNQTLVGITARTAAGATVVIPARSLLAKFKELAAGQ
jgi:hypothetical protein